VTAAGDAAYVAAALTLYADLPDAPSRPSPTDRSLARNLYKEAVPLHLVESALLLATLRPLARASDLPRFRGPVLLPVSCRSSPNYSRSHCRTDTSTTFASNFAS
jgi:hypothetical protein